MVQRVCAELFVGEGMIEALVCLPGPRKLASIHLLVCFPTGFSYFQNFLLAISHLAIRHTILPDTWDFA